MRAAMIKWVGAMAWVAAAGCSESTPKPRMATAPCPVELGRKPFHKANTIDVVIADFAPTGDGPPPAVWTTAGQIERAIRGFDVDRPGMEIAEAPPLDDTLEVAQVGCFVTDEDGALRLAEAWQADVVVWGKVGCPAADAGPEGRRACPEVTIVRSAPKPPIQPRETWSRPSVALRERAAGPSVKALADFVVGLHYFERFAALAALAAWAPLSSDAPDAPERGMAYLNALLCQAAGEGFGNDAHAGRARAIRYCRAALGQLDPDGEPAGAVHNLLGALLRRAEDRADSLAHGRRAVEIGRRVLGETHAATAVRLDNHVRRLVESEAYDEALGYGPSLLAAVSAAEGPRSRALMRAHELLALACRNQRRWSEAIEHWRAVLGFSRRIVGVERRRVTRMVLIGALRTVGRPAEAEAEARSWLADETRERGPESLPVARASSALASAVEASGRLHEAVELRRRALQIFEKRLKPDHLDIDIERIFLAQTLAWAGAGEGLPAGGAVIVETSVEGLRRGDRIVRFAGQPTPDRAAVIAAIKAHDGRVEVGIVRDAELLSSSVELRSSTFTVAPHRDEAPTPWMERASAR